MNEDMDLGDIYYSVNEKILHDKNYFINSNMSLKSNKIHRQKNNRKYYIGNTYMLRRKSINGSKEIIKKFILKKYIYTVKDQEINALIVKQIYGPKNNIYTLNKNDCLKYHIKYEPGLQVFPMSMNFIDITNYINLKLYI